MKYIDAERLQKDVKRLEKAAHKSALGCADSETRKFHEGKDFAYQHVGILIDSLQHEQDDKIEKIKKFVKEEADGWQDTYCDSMKDNILSFLDTLTEDPVQKFNTDKLQEIAKPATPHKKTTPEDREKFMEELHEYAESKKPDKSLEEEIRRYKEHYIKVKECGFSFDLMDIESTARHFAEWQASQMPMPEDTVLFNKGVQEGRRLEREDMMKVAMEGEAEKDFGWISVKDRLPKENKWVFVCVDMQSVPQCVGLGYLKDGEWCDDENDNGFCVDYWMKIPALPKEKQK